MAKVGFLDLPTEIRNRIYGLVFVHYPAVNPRPDTGDDDGPYNRNSWKHYCRLNDSVCPWLSPRGLNRKYETSMVGESDWDRPVKEEDVPISGVLSLLATCRQINDEARDIFFSLNIFSFNSPRLMKDAMSMLSTERLVLITQVETHIDLEKSTGSITSCFRDLEALQKIPSLKQLYITIALECHRQDGAKRMLDGMMPDFKQPGLVIVVEQVECNHCERNRLRIPQGFDFSDEGQLFYQAWMERQWWIWVRNKYTRHHRFQPIQRFGEEEIDVVGQEYRGRAKDNRWKRRYGEDQENYQACLVDREHCVSCGINSMSLKRGLARCPACRLAGYCSTECMQRDWPSHTLSCVLMTPDLFH